MIKKVSLIILVFVILIPSYWFYCKYFWNKFYDNHLYWEKPSTRNFVLASSKKVTNVENFTEHQWYRALIEPDHAMSVLEETISFPNDSTMNLNRVSHWVDENYWTYPLFRKFYGESLSIIKQYEFNNTEMAIYIECEAYGQPIIDTVQVELFEKRLIVETFFPYSKECNLTNVSSGLERGSGLNFKLQTRRLNAGSLVCNNQE